jgi:FkbM family methyltransferase
MSEPATVGKCMPLQAMIGHMIAVMRPLHFKGKYRLLNLVAPKQGVKIAQIFGAEFELNLADWIQRGIYLGTYEPFETRLISAYLRPGMTVADVGANVGYYTALAASKVGPQGRVFAIEPDARAFAGLGKLIARNHLPACALQIGLGEKSGEERLYQSPDSQNNTPTMVAHGGYAPKATVPIRRLDDCMDEWQVAYVDLLKIDVEGWEPQVFEGTSRALEAGRIGAILCEFNDHWLRAAGSSPQALWNSLKGFGFHPAGKIDLERSLGKGFFNCLLVR